MKLSIKDRLYIPQIFPKQGKFSEFNLKRSILSKVAITEDDKKTYSIKEDEANAKIEWDSEKDLSIPFEADFSKEEIAYLRKSCEALVETAYPDDFWVTVEKIYDASNE